jgi:hypothetical protein
MPAHSNGGFDISGFDNQTPARSVVKAFKNGKAQLDRLNLAMQDNLVGAIGNGQAQAVFDQGQIRITHSADIQRQFRVRELERMRCCLGHCVTFIGLGSLLGHLDLAFE